MSTTDDVTTQSPGIMMIEGREYALYQGLLERIQIADAKLLWVNNAQEWAGTLFVVLAAINAARPDSSLWLAFAALAAALGSVALSFFMDSRDALTTPFTVVERDRAGGRSTLVITSKSQRVSSTRPTGTTFATVHTEMADFLLTAFSEEKSRRFRQRPRVPAALRTPRALHQARAANASQLVALVALISIAVAFVNR